MLGVDHEAQVLLPVLPNRVKGFQSKARRINEAMTGIATLDVAMLVQLFANCHGAADIGLKARYVGWWRPGRSAELRSPWPKRHAGPGRYWCRWPLP